MLVHEIDSLQDLGGDLLALLLWKRLREMPLEIAVLGIFHGDEDAALVLEPSIRPNEAMSVLVVRELGDGFKLPVTVDLGD